MQIGQLHTLMQRASVPYDAEDPEHKVNWLPVCHTVDTADVTGTAAGISRHAFPDASLM